MTLISFRAKRLLVILSLLIAVSSCGKDSRTKIKIVNLEGKSKSIVTRTPDLNLQALQQQGNLGNSNVVIVNDRNSESYFKRFTKKIISSKEQKVVTKVASDSAATSEQPSGDNFGNFSSKAVNSSLTAQGQSLEGATPEVSQQVEEVNYDLSAVKAPPPVAPKEIPNKVVVDKTNYMLKSDEANKAVTPIKRPKTSNASGRYSVQVGSFSRYENAENSLKYMQKFHSGQINTVKRKSGDVHRVVLGPFSKRSEAGKVIKKVKSAGKQAILVINK